MNLEENIRILLVDDNAAIRKRLRILLGSVPEFEIVGEAENGKTAMVLTQELMPDVVIMDVNIPITNGIEASRWITFVSPDIKMISFASLKNEIRMMVKSDEPDLMYKFCADNEIVSTIKSLLKQAKNKKNG